MIALKIGPAMRIGYNAIFFALAFARCFPNTVMYSILENIAKTLIFKFFYV